MMHQGGFTNKYRVESGTVVVPGLVGPTVVFSISSVARFL